MARATSVAATVRNGSLGFAMLMLALAGCGGGNACKRACRKAAQCLADLEASGSATKVSSPAPRDGTGSVDVTINTDCDAMDTCDARSECQAKCLLKADCNAILSGSAALACAVSCAGVAEGDAGRDPLPMSNDAGPIVPISSPDSGLSCTPSCAGKQCGDDGCGGSCGSCGYGQSCSYGSCITSCTPSCAGKQCGDDGCGGSCGSCGYGQSCSYGSCVTATSTNSGQLCTQTTGCPAGETCMLLSATATTGMCLGACATTGDSCTTQGSGQFSVCAFTSQSTSGQFCAYLCEVQGQSFSCPNATDFDCVVYDTTQPDVKVCAPK